VRSSWPSLNIISSTSTSDFSAKLADGRALARASTIASLQIPVHLLFLNWKYGFRLGTMESVLAISFFFGSHTFRFGIRSVTDLGL